MSKYFNPKSWKDNSLLKCLQEYEPTLDINPESCICRSCRNDVNNIGDDKFVPRWRKHTITTEKNCYVPGCNSTASKVTKMTDRATVHTFYCSENESSENENTEDLSSEGTPLCTYHYGAWYRHLHPSHLKCKTCTKNIEATKSRPIPEPGMIQNFLAENAKFSGENFPEDRVCYACYRSHLFVIKHLQNSTQSTDSDLAILLDKIKGEIPALSEVHTFDSALLYVSSMCAIAIHVGEALLKQTAVLLPQIYDNFKTELLAVIQERGITSNQDHPSSTWLRSQLSSLLEHHMAYRCSILRYGTLLYRYGGDLVHALSISLGQSRTQSSKNSEKSDFQQTLSKTCITLNAKCHASIKSMIAKDASSPHQIEHVDIDEFIDQLDPDLWEAVCMLTQPSTKAAPSHVRKVRRFFSVCTLLFTINSECSFPLHTLVADAVETCGGSTRLMRLLNRLGVCACPETQSVKKSKGLRTELKMAAS